MAMINIPQAHESHHVQKRVVRFSFVLACLLSFLLAKSFTQFNETIGLVHPQVH
jgi:hypothetical protein